MKSPELLLIWKKKRRRSWSPSHFHSFVIPQFQLFLWLCTPPTAKQLVTRGWFHYAKWNSTVWFAGTPQPKSKPSALLCGPPTKRFGRVAPPRTVMNEWVVMVNDRQPVLFAYDLVWSAATPRISYVMHLYGGMVKLTLTLKPAHVEGSTVTNT